MKVPDEVIEAVAGVPVVGEHDLVLPLVTVGPHGHPHVCLLGRAELEAEPDAVHAVVAGSRTQANLRERGQAGLVVLTPFAAIDLALDVVALGEDPRWLPVSFAVASADVVAVGPEWGAPLEPARFLVTDQVVAAEDWPRAQRVLAALREGKRT
ncbi:hypothetical protein [Actinomycetospora sp. TBRC 11914]|uniref:hypothetical protein n=1 Tax=Actinomycetospora sp. TBRC 11914 TaxID=2729387 RepID=UPI00145CC44D|nr:hypothetical protein [Actinomycetospora sp. TBRC 11914]NMO91560.1 hypothetical protein [Actinomycetospora sp. TBRC 11914]